MLRKKKLKNSSLTRINALLHARRFVLNVRFFYTISILSTFCVYRFCFIIIPCNFLFLILQAEAIRTLKKYGVGSCGPRGFYGTMGKYVIC